MWAVFDALREAGEASAWLSKLAVRDALGRMRSEFFLLTLKAIMSAYAARGQMTYE